MITKVIAEHMKNGIPLVGLRLRGNIGHTKYEINIAINVDIIITNASGSTSILDSFKEIR